MTVIDFTELECAEEYERILDIRNSQDYELLYIGPRYVVFKAKTLKGCCILGFGMNTCLTSLHFSRPVNEAWDKFHQIEQFIFIIDTSCLSQHNNFYICLGKDYYEMYDKNNTPTNLNSIIDNDLKTFIYSNNTFKQVLSKYLEPLELKSTYYEDVDFSYHNITSLPLRMTFYGKVSFSTTLIDKLPDELYCEDDVDISYTNVDHLPNTLYLGRNLNLRHTKFASLPNNLRIRNNLNISETKIKVLPETLYVGGNLNLRECGIKTLPDMLYCGGTIYGFAGAYDNYPRFHFMF